MVYRVFVEKKKEFAHEAKALFNDLQSFLGINELEEVRIINRYDVENIDEELFDCSIKTIFSEPQLDIVSKNLSCDGYTVFAVEYLPGQFDQRADSAAQCIQIISQQERPYVRTAKVYLLGGKLSPKQIDTIKGYVINPVETREALLTKPDTLALKYDIPTDVQIFDDFNSLNHDELKNFINIYGLSMDIDDIAFCQEYFKSKNRAPSITEIRMIDTYWSDHCRHTTFNTIIDNVKFEDEIIEKTYEEYINIRKSLNITKPITLMDIATVALRKLKNDGKLNKLDESDEINACTVKIDVDIDGTSEPWLLLFKNETHNHPTEIEPFGGAATCIGGAIRDPLSGRAYVYGAMRITGAANPLKPLTETIEGKLPQRKIVTTAAAGYSSYGNQIGIATGIVDEIYHEGYVAKRMEIGAVIGAVPAKNVIRKVPQSGDLIILLGGRTGRDGCGGATGSSKAHTVKSLEACGAEVQKGNAPEERKLQRLFRNANASKMIKRCNDFGAGGVSVAVGELADGILINLNAITKKYDGLDGTELAISESQERMAVVISKEDLQAFIQLAESENLEASVIATVTEEPRLIMKWNNAEIVNIDREFLNSNGAKKHISANIVKAKNFGKKIPENFYSGYKELATDLNICSKRGLSERFDSTIGGGTVLMPFGGKNQLTPIQAMVHKIPVEGKNTSHCSLMSWGFNPFISENSPFHGAYLAVIESVSKLIATGADFNDIYLTLQEYFEKLYTDPLRWGKPLAALLGAFKAQIDLGIAAIGGKDSMSGSFEAIDVPPTLVSFAVTTQKSENIAANHFKKAGNNVILLTPKYDDNCLPVADSLIEVFNIVAKLLRSKKAVSAYALGYGGIAEAVMKMCFGEGFGFSYSPDVDITSIFAYNYGGFILEVSEDVKIGQIIGSITEKDEISYLNYSLKMSDLLYEYENTLESIYPCNISIENKKIEKFTFKTSNRKFSAIKTARPKVLIPVFPGTNCEFDTAKAISEAGAEPKIIVINNLSSDGILRSIENFAKNLSDSQMLLIPGGFSGGDEPDGSGKFITAFFRNPEIKNYVTELLEKRDGLICGICNGFQALIKLGLVPYGKIIDTDEACPTLTFNSISRHQSKIVRVRVASNMSPWLWETEVDDIYSVPISHGEGRFICSDELILQLAKNGQICTQYVDFDGNPTYNIGFNPNNSMYAVESICSPDGRVFGKMGHSERIGNNLYKNVLGKYDMKIFISAVKYFK